MKAMRKLIFWVGVILVVGVWDGYGEGGKKRVVSLSPVLTDFAREVGGDRVEVEGMVPAGKDPHLFEMTPKEVRKMAGADVILASGLGMESYLGKLRGALGKGVLVVEVGERVKPLEGECQAGGHGEEAHGHHHGHDHGVNPHWWHSVGNAEIAVEVIRGVLGEIDPENKAYYDANAAEYLKKLGELKKWIEAEVAGLPEEKRVLITTHDALGYFAKDFGFRVLPISGISTADHPTTKKVREVIDEIRAEGVKAIFVESTGNPKMLKEIARESGVRMGGVLFVDGLGAGEADTYEKMMRSNVVVMMRGLKGE